MSTISTRLIIEAVDFYQELGYQLIDVPQVVDFDVSQHTKPEGVPEKFHRGMKVYVASAEQSFLQLHKEGKLANGKYVAMTPCYRNESCLDDTHYNMFLKVELINVGSVNSEECVYDSKRFFDIYIPSVVVETDESINSFDIIGASCKTELGSYGVRNTLDGTSYVYGTGIAEPRFSVVLEKYYNGS
jgi:hypothetical protein